VVLFHQGEAVYERLCPAPATIFESQYLEQLRDHGCQAALQWIDTQHGPLSSLTGRIKVTLRTEDEDK
jgi:hypothetical protein